MGSSSVTGEVVIPDVEVIWRTRRTSMVAAVAAYCGQRDLAVDAVDEAFARALTRRARVEAMASPEGWILTVAFNTARRSAKRSGRRRAAERVDQERAGGWIEPHDPRFELWAAVRELPERQRMAIALRYLADLTEPQIAELMGVAVGTVGASLTAARRTLAGRLALSDAPDARGAPGGTDATAVPDDHIEEGGAR